MSKGRRKREGEHIDVKNERVVVQERGVWKHIQVKNGGGAGAGSLGA